MEATSVASRVRSHRFERECERLRPLGEAYVLRRFGSSLSETDAEDVVAEVLIRLHERAERGPAADNLRALFFTSAHNAAIDLLRARAARPQTVALDAAAAMPEPAPAPAERAEGRDNGVRLQEALARMRDGYRETMLLRFGLDLKLSEIAMHLGISETAAKKRLRRAATQVRKRMAQVEGEEFCPQMRELARDFAFEREAAGLASEAEGEVLRAHFSHCGPCRSYLVRLRAELHDLGSAALAGLLGGERIAGHVDILHRLAHLAGGAADAAQGGLERLRHLALRGAAPLSSGDGPAGAVMGTGQKIAAVCGAGAAATATCVLSGAVGPGIGAATHHPDPPQRPAAKVKRLSAPEAPAALPLQAPEEAAHEPQAGPAEPGGGASAEGEGGRRGGAARPAGGARKRRSRPRRKDRSAAERVRHRERLQLERPERQLGLERRSLRRIHLRRSERRLSGGEAGGEFGGSSSGATSGGSSRSGSGSSGGGSVGFHG